MRWIDARRAAMARRSRTREGKERGATTVLVAILLVALMGFSALAVDVGAMYAEKAQLQNGADSAALAIANRCAKGSCGDSTATGSFFANNNANDGTSGANVTFPSANTVRVVTKAREKGSASDGFSLFFARVMGFNTTQINATAEAKWGSPSGASTLPWTVSECVFEKYLSPTQLADLKATGNFTGDPIPTHILMRYDENAPAYPGCAAQNGYEPGGFGWLKTTSGCSTDISVGSTVQGQTGNTFPTASECNALLATIMDQPALIPLFSSATGNGSNATYTLVGFAAFQVTGYKFGGPSVTQLDPLAPSCTGNCRGLQGYFSRFVSLEEGLKLSGSIPNFGGAGVALSQ